MAVALAATLGASALAGGGQLLGSYLQGKSADAALEEQTALAREQMAAQEAAAADASGILGRSGKSGRADIEAGTQGAISALNQGMRGAEGFNQGAVSSLQAGTDQATRTLGLSQANALSALQGGTQGFEQAMGQGLAGGLGALQQGQGGVQNLQNLIGSGQAFQGFEQDPGYAFRQQQGEQAINRSAAARGGRLGGRTLKELGQFNQGLASQEFGNFANRRSQELGMMQGLAGMQQQGGAQQANLLFGAGQGVAGQRAGAAGDAARLGAMFGTQQAGMQQGLGSQLAGIYGNQANQQLGLGSQLAGLATGQGTQQAQLGLNVAQGQANALTGGAAGAASIGQNLMNQMNNPTQYAGQTANIGGQMAANMGQNIATALLSERGGSTGGGQTYSV